MSAQMSSPISSRKDCQLMMINYESTRGMHGVSYRSPRLHLLGNCFYHSSLLTVSRSLSCTLDSARNMSVSEVSTPRSSLGWVVILDRSIYRLIRASNAHLEALYGVSGPTQLAHHKRYEYLSNHHRGVPGGGWAWALACPHSRALTALGIVAR